MSLLWTIKNRVLCSQVDGGFNVPPMDIVSASLGQSRKEFAPDISQSRVGADLLLLPTSQSTATNSNDALVLVMVLAEEVPAT
jgi:hypothetical protein